MEDWFPRGVSGKHPHRGIETVTYVVEGRIDRYDNQGHEGTILPGDVQWMTAGRGLIHNEIPAEGVTVHSLQLWVNLPAADKMTAPRYQDLAGDAVPVRREPGVEVRVFSGASGQMTGPTKNFVPVTMVEIRLDRGAWIRDASGKPTASFSRYLSGPRLRESAASAEVRRPVEKAKVAAAIRAVPWVCAWASRAARSPRSASIEAVTVPVPLL